MTLEWIRRQEPGVRQASCAKRCSRPARSRITADAGHGCNHPREPAVARGLREGACANSASACWRTRRPAPCISASTSPCCFEDELTVRYQIQEMLRIEKVFEEAGIQDELDAYNPLVPDGTNLKATMLIEYEDPDERIAALARLVGIERRVWIEVAGQPACMPSPTRICRAKPKPRPRRCISCVSSSIRRWCRRIAARRGPRHRRRSPSVRSRRAGGRGATRAGALADLA